MSEVGLWFKTNILDLGGPTGCSLTTEGELYTTSFAGNAASEKSASTILCEYRRTEDHLMH
jgi:hypothetical protein